MLITACLLDGLEIVGFEVMNNKGLKKNLSYEKTLVYAQQKKLDGISYRKINNQEFLVGLDYLTIDKKSIQNAEYKSLNFVDNKVTSVAVHMDDNPIDLSLSMFYNLLLNEAVNFDNIETKNNFEVGIYEGNKLINIK